MAATPIEWRHCPLWTFRRVLPAFVSYFTRVALETLVSVRALPQTVPCRERSHGASISNNVLCAVMLV